MYNYIYKKGTFENTFESLGNFECPKWFGESKLGIWSHWGPQSVPMYGDWYARNMYIEGHPQYLYHLRKYGHPSQFGYKDIIDLWKAENFDPDGLMELYKAAGAKYFVAQAMHHDNFFNYDSKIHEYNSVNYGPKKDIVAMWKKAAVSRGLKFGISEHHGAAFEWSAPNKRSDRFGPFAGVPYDGRDTKYRELYLDNEDYADPSIGRHHYTHDDRWPPRWFEAIKEVVDTFEPDLLYSDGAIPFYKSGAERNDPTYIPGLSMVAHFYNSNIERNGVNQAVYLQKDSRKPFYSIGLLDLERSREDDIKPTPWQTDTCLGNWFYDIKAVYKTYKQVIETFVDIISKNGNLLLNIPQLPDGSIDHECRYVLEKMAEWIAVCSEAVYGTQPYTVAGEGPSKFDKSRREEATQWSEYDFRYTQKGENVYCFIMGNTHNPVLKHISNADMVKDVILLGYGRVSFCSEYGSINISLPEKLPLDCCNCLMLQF